ncbi:hypothetical protein BC937DRAFT_91285 [Endogone sp. FLAS-F59071]|nr:hypothetical protein BC937DRAFT_91285 [Endogone sp. FLAS-F59071]|eukprot:RUS21852.1 hypothetical protein BC937DRAFT_91285 [Endogone sp. FLAS-F59071]
MIPGSSIEVKEPMMPMRTSALFSTPQKRMLKAFTKVEKTVYSPEHPEGHTETIVQAGTPAVDPAVQSIKDQATSQDEAELGLSAPQEYEQHCILFPAYATKQKDDGTIFFKHNLVAESCTHKLAVGASLTIYCFPTGTVGNDWQIRIRGWAFQAPKNSHSRDLVLDLTSYFTGIHSSTDERWEILQARTQLFWASNFDHGVFTVRAIGVTHSSKMEVEGDPTNKNNKATAQSESFLSSTTKSISDAVSSLFTHSPGDIKPADQKAVQSSDAKISNLNVNANHTIRIKPEAGHFQGTIIVSDEDIKRWSAEEKAFTSDHKVIRLLKLQAFQTETLPPAEGVVNLVNSEGTSIISDIDDTIKDTEILAGGKAVLSNTFLHEFKEVPGMSDIYSTLYARGASIHYVSNGPWQLFPMIRGFFQTYAFPPGSAHMKFYDGLIKSAYQQKENPMASKFFYIRELLKDFPHRKFILIGDTGELDPEIYTTIAREHPNQIIRIFIRDVTTARVKDFPPEEPHASYLKTFPVLVNHIYAHYTTSDSATSHADSANVKQREALEALINKQLERDEHLDAEVPNPTELAKQNGLVGTVYNDLAYLYSTLTPTAHPDNHPKTPASVVHSATVANVPNEQRTNEHEVVLKTPLEMFHERITILTNGLPNGLFSLFTDVTRILNDDTVKKAFKTNSWW